MADISALGIKITSSGVVKTIKELQDFSKAASAARRAASKPINIRVGNTGIAKALADIKRLETALRGVGGKSGASGARLNVTGGAAAVREINRFAKAVTDARAKVGSGITVQLRANGSQAAVRSITEYQRAVNQAQQSAERGANFNMTSSGSSANINGATTSIVGLGRAVLGLASAFGVLTAGRFFTKVADESNLIAARLRLATVETGNFAQAQEDARRIAASSRSDLDTTATLYGRIMMSAKELGIAQRDAAKATETITKSFKVSGATTIEAENATRQLIQALQSGVLRGDEFRSVMEQAPRLARAIADGMDIPITKLRELAHDGKITTDVLLDAVIKANEEINKEFEGMPVTFSEAMGQIYNAAVVTFGAFDRGGEFSKSITSFILGGTNDLESMERAAEKLGRTIRTELAGVTAVFQGLADQVRAVKGWFDALANTGLGSWVGRVVDQLSTLASYLNPIANALRFIRSVGAGARADELARQRAEMEGGFAGRYLDRFGDQLGGGQSTQAIAKTTEEKKKAKTASERLAERLAREAEATRVLTLGNYEAVEGYRKSTAAGKMAEVAAEARAKGIKAQGDVTAYVTRELKKYVSEQAKSAAENNASMREQIAAQQMVNKAVAEGSLSVENASIAISNMIEQRKILNAIELAKKNKDGEGEKALRIELEKLTKQQIEYNAAVREAADLAAADAVKNSLPLLRKQIDLEKEIGKARMDAMRSLSGNSLTDKLQEIEDYYERQSIILEFNAKIDEARRLGQTKLIEQLQEEMKLRLEMAGVRQGSAKKERTFEENRRLTLNLANDVANLIGGKLGDTFSRLIQVLDETFNNLAASLGEKFGGLMKAFSEGMKTGGAFGALTGSRTGGALGGGIGQVLGEEFLTKGLTDMFGKTIGKFAGPLGAIAGGLLGGVIGGMLKSTPRASATVSIIAGEAMDTAIKGSSDKLRKIAGGLANGVIDGLTSLADQLGAQLVGDANVSIGMRKKNYRVDPTGRGITKTSKGAIDFGDDQAAATAYAIQVAIQQGVLGGLSESMKRLIMADGDLQTQLQKALNFKSVFDELHQRLDPEGFDLAQLDKWRAGMDKIFAEAGATAEELAKLEELTGLKRAEIVEKYAEKVVNNEELIREKRQLEIQIMDLEGKSIEALAARRDIERMAADESLRPLYDRIYALQDEAAATEEANRIAEEAAAIQRAIADERYGLESRLLQLQGDTNALRQREIDAINPANQALLQMIFNLEDFQAQAESAAKAAADAAAAQKSISDEIGGLERQWLELIGDTESLRELRLGDLLSDDARAMQQMIWAEEDRQEAVAAAAAEAARAAEQAAQAYARAVEEYNKRVEAARDVLVQAYQRESGALQQTIDKFREFSRSIREFRDSLIAGNNPSLGLAQARATFTSTSRMAGLGSEKALGSFTGDAQAYLDAAQNFGSFDDYQRALAAVLGGSSNAIKGSDSMVSTASMQLDRLTKIMTELGLLNEETVSFNQALTEYNRILTEEAIPDFTKTVSRSIDNLSHQVAEGNSITEETGEVTKITLESIVISMNQVARILGRAEREGRLAVTLDGEPISGSVTIANVPLPVDQVP